MREFEELLALLHRETTLQEDLLEVLSRERAAIVSLNQQHINDMSVEKEALLAQAQEIGEKRNAVISALHTPANSRVRVKLKDVIEKSPSEYLRRSLERAGAELRITASSVQEMNTKNAELVHQSLGLVLSVLSIFRSAQGEDLPVYGHRGELRNEPASSGSRSFQRSA